MPAFHADSALRATLLAQIEAHAAQGTIKATLTISGQPIKLYTFGRDMDVAHACNDLLGLPTQLVNLGMYLFDGFPETLAERRAFIMLRHAMLDAFPLGAELDDSAGIFCYHMLKEARYGLVALIHSAESAALYREVLEALEVDPQGAFLDADLRQRLHAAIEHEVLTYRLLWQSEQRIDPVASKTRHLLEVLAAVSRLPIDLDAAAAAAEASFYGAHVQAAFEHDALLRTLFVRVLRRS